MKPFKPKEYKRSSAVFNLYRRDCVRLVFPSEAKIRDNPRDCPEGDYADGRRLASFSSIGNVNSKRLGLQAAIRSRYRIVTRGHSEVPSTESSEPQIVLRDSPFAKVIPGTACAYRKSRNI